MVELDSGVLTTKQMQLQSTVTQMTNVDMQMSLQLEMMKGYALR